MYVEDGRLFPERKVEKSHSVEEVSWVKPTNWLDLIFNPRAKSRPTQTPLNPKPKL